MARPSYLVRPSAWRLWDEFPEVEHPLTDIVDGFERVPESELEVTGEFRPPAVIHEVVGEVFGRRFLVRGIRRPDGKWVEVWSVRPLQGPGAGMLGPFMGGPR